MSSSEEEISTTFCPTDQELVVEYLRPKNEGLPLPTNKIIDHVDLYLHNPDEIAGQFDNNTCGYFFTQNTRRYMKREAGNGYWRAVGADMDVKYKGDVVGLRKFRVYYTKDGEKTNWIMHEFRLYELARGLPITNNDDGEKVRIKLSSLGFVQPQPRVEEWVLCRICKRERT